MSFVTVPYSHLLPLFPIPLYSAVTYRQRSSRVMQGDLLSLAVPIAAQLPRSSVADNCDAIRSPELRTVDELPGNDEFDDVAPPSAGQFQDLNHFLRRETHTEIGNPIALEIMAAAGHSVIRRSDVAQVPRPLSVPLKGSNHTPNAIGSAQPE